MKKLAFATLINFAALSTFPVEANSQPQDVQQNPVFDAQAYVVLKNIEARLAELNLKLSEPKVSGCSDGEHVYTPGISIKKDGSSYRCDLVQDGYKWTYEISG